MQNEILVEEITELASSLIHWLNEVDQYIKEIEDYKKSVRENLIIYNQEMTYIHTYITSDLNKFMNKFKTLTKGLINEKT